MNLRRKPDEILNSVADDIKELLLEFKEAVIRQRVPFRHCGTCGKFHQPLEEYCSKPWNKR